MNRLIRLPLVGAACILMFGCRGDTASPIVDTPTYAVSDGAHNGNPDFFFLPPLFKSPTTNPNYEPTGANMSLKPAVEICELGAAAADGSRECIAGPPVKRFDPSVVTTTVDQAYMVNWKTDESALNIDKFYRIRVLVGSTLLGFADVDPVGNGSQLKNVLTNEYIGWWTAARCRSVPDRNWRTCAVDGTPCASKGSICRRAAKSSCSAGQGIGSISSGTTGRSMASRHERDRQPEVCAASMWICRPRSVLAAHDVLRRRARASSNSRTR
jgi:hypothetical protein